MSNIWFRLLFAALVFSVNTAEGQKLHRFSVSHTVDYAMKNATAIQNALLDIKIQEQTNREITAMAYPQLNTSLTYNQYIELPTSLVPAEFGGGTPGTFIPIQFGTKYNVTGGIDFNQILFNYLKNCLSGLNEANFNLDMIVDKVTKGLYNGKSPLSMLSTGSPQEVLPPDLAWKLKKRALGASVRDIAGLLTIC